MAVLAANSLLLGMTGMIGDLMFREVDGRIIIQTRPSGSKSNTEVQKLNREKFKMAAEFAHQMMRDKAMKMYYWKRAKKKKLPNGYTAAIQDYMTRPKVKAVDLHRYTGEIGGSVVVQMRKRESPLAEVVVTIKNKDGQEIERGNAVFRGGNAWVYRNTVRTKGMEGLRYQVDIKDFLGNGTTAFSSGGESVMNLHDWEAPPLQGVAELMGIKV